MLIVNDKLKDRILSFLFWVTAIVAFVTVMIAAYRWTEKVNTTVNEHNGQYCLIDRGQPVFTQCIDRDAK